MTASELDKLISSLKGKVVLVNYWATWCGPCRLEIPGFIKLQNEYGPKGLQIVGLSIDTKSTEQVAKFVRDSHINYPVFVADQDAARKWGEFEAIPMTFLLDAQGKKIWQHEGFASADVFESQIKPLLPK
jgi:thiol-disulfide isomerase/thioredoxin